MTNDIRNARINRKLKTNPELRRLAEDLTNAQEVATFAHEQMNPLQEMTAGLFGVLAGDAVSANALFADYVGRVIAGEAMGDLTDPARAILGHNDARAGKDPESPDVGYLSGYCDGLIENDETADAE